MKPHNTKGREEMRREEMGSIEEKKRNTRERARVMTNAEKDNSVRIEKRGEGGYRKERRE